MRRKGKGSEFRRVVEVSGGVLLAALGAALLALIVHVDALVLRNGVSEGSLTEILQEWLLALSVLAVARRAWHDPPQRGFAVLMAGFFGAMLIREMDGVLDRMLGHGSWKGPVTIWLVFIALLVWRNRRTVLAPMAEYTWLPSFPVLVIGLVTVLVFSRLIGMGRLWLALQQDPPLRTVKNAVEEGVELYGYGMIAYAAVAYENARHKRSSK